MNTELSVASALETEDDVIRTGVLHYTATVIDPTIGRDQYTEVIVTPSHHLTNIYAT